MLKRAFGCPEVINIEPVYSKFEAIQRFHGSIGFKTVVKYLFNYKESE